MNRSWLANLFRFVFVHLLCYSLFLPLLPYFATSPGNTPFAIRLLATSNAIARLVVAPVLGGAIQQLLPPGSSGVLAALVVALRLIVNWLTLPKHGDRLLPGCGWATNGIAA